MYLPVRFFILLHIIIAENVQLIILCWCIVCYIISVDDTESGLQYHARLETEQQRRQSKLSLTGKHSCFDIRFWF